MTKITSNKIYKKPKLTIGIIIRSIIFNFCYLFLSILFSVSALINMFGKPIYTLYVAKIWSKSSLFLLKHICKLDYKITGMENIPTNTNVIFASKHQSAWETVAYQAFFYPTVFMFKKELLFIPLFGINLLKSGNIPVKRGTTTKSTLKKLQTTFEKKLKSRNIIVFPEGTRTKIGETDQYKSGLSLIVKGLDTTIIPIAMNSGLFWGKKSFIKYPGTIEIYILKGIKTKNMSPKDIQEKLISAIETKMHDIT